MNKVMSWVIGLTIGGAVGALVVMLLVPISGDEIIRRLKAGYQETMQEARLASAKRQAELEAELATMQKRRQLPQKTGK